MTTLRERAQLDRDPDKRATAEWLVVSTEADAANAALAVTQARERGMRVNQLVLAANADLETTVLNAAVGIKHVVVAGREDGALRDNISRLLPHIGVVPASSTTAPVAVELVLERLLRTPRCC